MPIKKEQSAARRQRAQWLLCWRWVGASAVGELVALPLAALIVSAAIQSGAGGASLLLIVAGALAGMVNGAIVAGLQWLALRRPVQQLSGWRWTLMTALGSALPWVWGISKKSSLYLAQGNDAAVLGTVLLLALLVGVVLGGAQWTVLRRVLHHAGWWMPVSILAWLLGVVVLVGGGSLIHAGTPLWSLLLVSGITGLVVGSLVGIITGLALVGLTSFHVVRSRPVFREPMSRRKIMASSRPVVLQLVEARSID
jgi:hypothetical protein